MKISRIANTRSFAKVNRGIQRNEKNNRYVYIPRKRPLLTGWVVFP